MQKYNEKIKNGFRNEYGMTRVEIASAWNPFSGVINHPPSGVGTGRKSFFSTRFLGWFRQDKRSCKAGTICPRWDDPRRTCAVVEVQLLR